MESDDDLIRRHKIKDKVCSGAVFEFCVKFWSCCTSLIVTIESAPLKNEILILACKTLADHRVHPWRTECHFARTGRVPQWKLSLYRAPTIATQNASQLHHFTSVFERISQKVRYLDSSTLCSVHKVSTLTRFVAAESLVSQLICIIASKLAFGSIFGVCTQFHL